MTIKKAPPPAPAPAYSGRKIHLLILLTTERYFIFCAYTFFMALWQDIFAYTTFFMAFWQLRFFHGT